MLGSLFGVVSDVAKIVAAPVVIAAEVTRSVTKPVAQEATKAVEAIKKELR